MNLNRILIAVIIVIIAIFLWKVTVGKTPVPPVQSVDTQVLEEENIEIQPAATAEENSQVNPNQPNAINVVAPGYNNAQQKVQQLKQLKQQATEEQQKSLDSAGL